MICPECGKDSLKIIDSRPDEYTVWRRRKCLMCKFRFTTYELTPAQIKRPPAKVLKMVIGDDTNIKPRPRRVQQAGKPSGDVAVET